MASWWTTNTTSTISPIVIGTLFRNFNFKSSPELCSSYAASFARLLLGEFHGERRVGVQDNKLDEKSFAKSGEIDAAHIIHFP
jgi:hypothetical protein